MENFIDENYMVHCPKCSRLINPINFRFSPFLSHQNLFIDYFCKICYQISLSEKKDSNNNKESNDEKSKIESISLFSYLKQFFYKPKIICKKHKHNQMCLFFNVKKNIYNCILCVLEKHEKIKSNIIPLNDVLKLHYKTKKPSISKIRVTNKEKDCIRCIVSLSPYILCYVIDKRVCVWDYSLNKIIYSLVEINYIQNIIPITDFNNRTKNELEDNTISLLLTYGTSLRLWNLKNVEKSKCPTLLQDNYDIIQEAIQISGKNLISFLTEDGLFIWDFSQKLKNKQDELKNVLPLSDFTSNFLSQISENIICFGCSKKVYLYDYIYNVKNYIFTEDDNEEIVYGKRISFNRLVLLINPNIFKIFQINSIKTNKENESDEIEIKVEINFECMYKDEIKLEGDYWNYYIEECKDLHLIGFFDQNQIYLINVFTGDKNVIYEYVENEKNCKKNGINKVIYLGKNKIGLIKNNETLDILNIDNGLIETSFINKSYGKISTFEFLHNGDIAIAQIKQEFFYSISILE